MSNKQKQQSIRSVSDLYINGVDTDGMTIEQALKEWEKVVKSQSDKTDK